MTIAEFTQLALKNHVRYANWRWGQALFNTLDDVSPAIANRVRATDVDPFYNDMKIPAFYSTITPLLEELERV